MKTKIFYYYVEKLWHCLFALLFFTISQSTSSQTQIVYHTFNSGFSSSAGGNSIVSSLLGQTIFGMSSAEGFSIYSGYSSFGKGLLLSVNKSNGPIPAEFALYQNFPNPFNPSTTIRYGLSASSRVSIKIYNVIGQQIAEIINIEQPEGSYEAVWNATVASGLYIYRIEAISITDPKERFTQSKKMLLVR